MSERTTLTIQLVPTKDDDLLGWITAIPKGGRNTALKQVLRCGLDLPQPGEHPDEIAALRYELESIKTAVSRLPETVQSNGSTDFDHIQRQIDSMAELVHHIAARLDGIALGDDQRVNIIQPTPELTSEEKKQRANRLKKARW